MTEWNVVDDVFFFMLLKVLAQAKLLTPPVSLSKLNFSSNLSPNIFIYSGVARDANIEDVLKIQC